MEPPPPVDPAAWGAAHFYLPDGPQAGGLWDPSTAPYLIEPLQCAGPDHPCNTVAIMKAAQTGASIGGLVVLGAIICADPAPCLVAQPTTKALEDFTKNKLDLAIKSSPALAARVEPQKSRDGNGSTTTRKTFPGGHIGLVHASSPSELASHTVRFLLADEVDRWPDDVGGEGDPWELAQARLNAYRAAGTHKTLAISTPTIDTASRIQRLYEDGDQREYRVCCPDCGAAQALTDSQLVETETGAGYACLACGSVWPHASKRQLLQPEAGAHWVPTNPDGAYPSFHVPALISTLVTWGDILAKKQQAEHQPDKLQSYRNLWLGLPHKRIVQVTDPEELLARRGLYRRGTVPAGPVFLTAGIDVQDNRLEVEIIGWDRHKRSWAIDWLTFPGDTSTLSDPCWQQAAALMRKTWHGPQGQPHRLTAVCIDTGGHRTNQVYTFSRSFPQAYPIKGLGAPGLPAITQGSVRAIRDHVGRVISGAVRLYLVGTWALKADLFTRLALKQRGVETPPGWCAFSADHDVEYFRQLTSETLVDKVLPNGNTKPVWVPVPGVRNDILDCRVYATAAAYQAGLDTLADADWDRLELIARTPAAGTQAELFPAPLASPADAAVPPSTAAPSSTYRAQPTQPIVPQRRRATFDLG